MSDELCAVDLGECCRRLGISRATGERLLRVGKFPIPELPRLGTARGRLTFSTADIDRYLDRAATEDRRRWRVAK